MLVVDDSITVRELERQLLEGRGYVVNTAVNGIDGWNAVRSGRYDLVVSDIDMPRMDGIQLVRHIKEDARLQAIPVVVVSYKDREEDRIKGLAAGTAACPIPARSTCSSKAAALHDPHGARLDLAPAAAQRAPAPGRQRQVRARRSRQPGPGCARPGVPLVTVRLHFSILGSIRRR